MDREMGSDGTCEHQIRRKTMVVWVPPKPKERDIATSIFMSRAALAQ
jgi:hypothetical protein